MIVFFKFKIDFFPFIGFLRKKKKKRILIKIIKNSVFQKIGKNEKIAIFMIFYKKFKLLKNCKYQKIYGIS